jgi:transglutaminase-like putative cysteine protease
MVGADASHAWVSVYCPELEGGRWVDFDPTNNLLPDTQHITLAWGRDFADVSPLRGIILGGDAHELDVAVTVTPRLRAKPFQPDVPAQRATPSWLARSTRGSALPGQPVASPAGR